MTAGADGWWIDIGGTGFKGRVQIELAYVPLEGTPVQLEPKSFIAQT